MTHNPEVLANLTTHLRDCLSQTDGVWSFTDAGVHIGDGECTNPHNWEISTAQRHRVTTRRWYGGSGPAFWIAMTRDELDDIMIDICWPSPDAPRKSKRTHGLSIHWLHLAALALGCAIPVALSAASGVGVVGALLAVIA